jgi:hypothetical protein
VKFELAKKDPRKAFFASCAYLTGMLTSVVFGVYSMVLPATVYSLTATSAKGGVYGLEGRARLVDHRDDPGGALLHIPVPIVCGQGRRGREPARVRRVTSRCRAVLANT